MREVASMAVWFDSFVTNVDRTARNPNLLCWHKSLYYARSWGRIVFSPRLEGSGGQRAIALRAHQGSHPVAHGPPGSKGIDPICRGRLNEEVFVSIMESVPGEWLLPEPGVPNAAKRRAYVDYLLERLKAAPIFLEEALRARSVLV